MHFPLYASLPRRVLLHLSSTTLFSSPYLFSPLSLFLRPDPLSVSPCSVKAVPAALHCQYSPILKDFVALLYLIPHDRKEHFPH